MGMLKVAGLVLGISGVMLAQSAFSNPIRPVPAPINASPYGNILFPGGVPPSIGQGHIPALSGTVSGRIPYTGVPAGSRPGVPGRNRTVVVPYAVPVWYGGYGGGYYDYPQAQQPTNVTVVVPQPTTPSVIINQTFTTAEGTRQEVKEYAANDSADNGGIRVYEPGKRTESARETRPRPAPEAAATAEPRSYVRDGKPTIYLIALKDSTIRQALGYWVEGANLSYVTPQASIQHVGLDQIDRETSVRLNEKRKLEFDLKVN